jgi:hypothetical protein
VSQSCPERSLTSAPRAMSTSPPETRQAHPEEEPPVVRPKAYGLCTGPVMLEKDEGQQELFSVLALPSN